MYTRDLLLTPYSYGKFYNTSALTDMPDYTNISANFLTSMSRQINTDFMYPNFDINFSSLNNFNDYYLSMRNYQMTMQTFDMYLNMTKTRRWMYTLNTNYNTSTKGLCYNPKNAEKLPALWDVYNPELSKGLAKIAENNANRTNTEHRCYAGVKDALAQAGLNKGEFTGGSACDAINILRGQPDKWQRVYVDINDLGKLPAGCVIVWEKNSTGTRPADLHGHIAITLGNGKEACDRIMNVCKLKTKFYVFVPIEPKKK